MSVRRYMYGQYCMKESEAGDYVLHDDYAALESSNTRLQADNIRLTLRVENLEAECARLRQELEDIQERAQDEAWDRDTRS